MVLTFVDLTVVGVVAAVVVVVVVVVVGIVVVAGFVVAMVVAGIAEQQPHTQVFLQFFTRSWT